MLDNNFKLMNYHRPLTLLILPSEAKVLYNSFLINVLCVLCLHWVEYTVELVA